MIRRWLTIAAIPLFVATSAAAQEFATDAERSWRELRNSSDAKTKLMAERWYNAIREQEWGDASGKFKTTAKYLEHDPALAWVKLRVIQGTGDKRVVKDVTIPLEKLSKSCQARVRTIGVLSEKIADAIEKEKHEEEKKVGEGRAGELPEERVPGGEPRGGRGGYDAGLAGMDAGEVVAEGEPPGRGPAPESAPPQPIVATNNGPPLPALLPPLPSSDALRETSDIAASQPATEATPATESAGPAEFKHPTTAEELRDAFAQAFGAGDKATLDRLVYWGDTSPELRRLTYSSLLDHAGAARLARWEIEAQEEGGEPVSNYNLNSTTFLRVEFETRSDYFEMDWPVGEIDGKYYLGALIQDGTQSPRR